MQPLQLVQSLEACGAVLTLGVQQQMLQIMDGDPVLAVLPLPVTYRSRLLKRLIATAEAQGQELSEELVALYTKCLALAAEVRTGRRRHAPVSLVLCRVCLPKRSSTTCPFYTYIGWDQCVAKAAAVRAFRTCLHTSEAACMLLHLLLSWMTGGAYLNTMAAPDIHL